MRVTRSPAPHDNPTLLTLIFRELERCEAKLLTVPPADVAAHVCARVGAVDLSPFGV